MSKETTGLRLPEVGDKFFEQFESDYKEGLPTYTITRVGHPIYHDSKQEYEGREVFIEDLHSWFDCFWSERLQMFVYALE